jgi:hypothetical protein
VRSIELADDLNVSTHRMHRKQLRFLPLPMKCHPVTIARMPRKRRQKPVRNERCATCVTKTQAEGGIYLRPGALEQIQAAAINGIC